MGWPTMSRSLSFTAVFLLLGIVQLVIATPVVPGIRPPNEFIFSQTTEYPTPNQGHIHMHDPSIVESGGYFYLFRGGIQIPIFRSDRLDGPWTKIGTVLDGPSVIKKQNRTRPWAPTTVEYGGKFYCFYTLSRAGARNSAIGVATTDSLETDDGGSWTDHGALINTEHGPLSQVYPYTQSNAIDASFITDQQTGQPYLIYGSYWHGIFQVPLSDDLLSVKNKKHPDARNLAYLSTHKPRYIEGSFMSYHEPYYYLWFSHGKCCGFQNGFPNKGEEYRIRVGRSKNVRGPFSDKTGRLLTDGGGTTVYGSNHGDVYAPGGVGVLSGNDDRPDILYYHYMNTSVGFLDHETLLGYSFLDYVDGWPEAKQVLSSNARTLRTNYTLNLLALMCMCYLILNLHKRFPSPKLIIPVGFLVLWVFIWVYPS